MKTAGKYEAAGSLWWFALVGKAVKVESKTVFTADVKRLAVEAAAIHWDEDTYLSSDLVEYRRFFTFPGAIPTACSGIPDVQQTVDAVGKQKKGATFKALPLLAGRAVVLAYLEAVYGAMESGNGERLKKLFEAIASTHALISSKVNFPNFNFKLY